MPFLVAVSAAALVVALVAVWYYAALGLTLSHYDAKAHLVVARRIFDSLAPGWRQIGAVWLPLPHLLNALPVQVDAFYRSGASGVALSVAAHVLATGSLAWLTLAATGSRAAALVTACAFATDPNVLYLQATPMTEPLVLGFMALGVAVLYGWTTRGGSGLARGAGLALAAACLTRYEAWPLTAAAVGLAWLALWRRGSAPLDALRRIVPIALPPALAILGFLVLSRATVGEWFVTGGFYEIHNKAQGAPLLALVHVWWGLRQLVGTATLLVGAAGAVGLTVLALRRPGRSELLVVLALTATAALPSYAFASGHPFRIRYMVVLVAAVAACAGIGVGLLPRRVRAVAAALAITVILFETPPFWRGSPLVAEAQWDSPNSVLRHHVTSCLQAAFKRPDDKVLASMGSLAHYMQELSHAGFALTDFVHEGIGESWAAALNSPDQHVQWILFEEQSEGGDVLTALRRQTPEFVAGFTRVCAGGGVALYRKDR